jgi:hypothetical protein
MSLLVCLFVTLAVLVYVFYLPGTLRLDPQKTRVAYLRERKDVVYENMRDLNFEFKAGKLSEADYVSLNAGLEEEAAGVLAEISRLENSPTVAPSLRPRKGPRV